MVLDHLSVLLLLIILRRQHNTVPHHFNWDYTDFQTKGKKFLILPGVSCSSTHFEETYIFLNIYTIKLHQHSIVSWQKIVSLATHIVLLTTLTWNIPITVLIIKFAGHKPCSCFSPLIVGTFPTWLKQFNCSEELYHDGAQNCHITLHFFCNVQVKRIHYFLKVHSSLWSSFSQ